MKNRLCIICARGGSKGLPGKNIRMIAGKPLIAHSIDHAKCSKLFESVVVSSDSDEILQVAKEYGAQIIKRPSDLATDEAGAIPAVVHALKTYEKQVSKTFDTVVLLQATSPIREIEDIIESVKILENTSAPNVVSASISKDSPYYNILEEDLKGNLSLSKKLPDNIVRRQDAPTCYTLNGSIYVWKRDVLIDFKTNIHPDTKIYVMPEERSVDIDTIWDFKYAETILKMLE